MGVPETNQKIGGESEHLQQEITLKKGITEHNTTHRPLEESQQSEETGQSPLLFQLYWAANGALQFLLSVGSHSDIGLLLLTLDTQLEAVVAAAFWQALVNTKSIMKSGGAPLGFKECSLMPRGKNAFL